MGSPSPRPVRSLTLALALLAGCADDDASTSRPMSRGRLVVEPAKLEVLADKTSNVEASVLLKNEGSVAIDVLEVTTKCGCMSPQATWKPRLGPGESTRITFAVQPMSYGVRRTSMAVRTNSGDQPEVSIPIEIKGPPLKPPYVRYAPDQLSKRIEPGATKATLPFSIICVEKKDEPLWFLGCDSTLRSVSFTAPELIEEQALDDEAVRREYRVVASISSLDFQAERLTGLVTLKVASPPIRPLKTFLLRLTNEPAVYCTPAALLVRSPARSYKVVLRSDDEVAFRIRSAEADKPLVSIDFDPEPERDTHVLNVNVAAGSNNRDSCRIVFATTHPHCETVELTVVWESGGGESIDVGTD